jgi:hypothetical protein
VLEALIAYFFLLGTPAVCLPIAGFGFYVMVKGRVRVARKWVVTGTKALIIGYAMIFASLVGGGSFLLWLFHTK